MKIFSKLSIIAFFAIGSLALNTPENKNNGIISSIKEKLFSNGNKWVVLVSGSYGWQNYRHQADICHAYQIIRENGIPEKNIITMMVDDIAYNKENPTPGRIVNQPNGTNVYKGVVIDYRGSAVNPQTFLNVITGNKKAVKGIGSGKVVDGGSFDHVFINFVDHGATGILGFPDDILMADELNEAFNHMYGNKSYSQVLVFIEACEAGSMFDGILNENKNVFAVTASGPREYSWACYCTEYGRPYNTCLADLFSAIWMENLDETSSNPSAKRRNIFNDFADIRHRVNTSNVMAYGDFNVGHQKLSSFIGFRKTNRNQTAQFKLNNIRQKSSISSQNVSANEIKLQFGGYKLSSLERQNLEIKIQHNKKMRLIIDNVFRSIFSLVAIAKPGISNAVGEFEKPNYLQLSLDMFPCYRSILNMISMSCFSVPRNPYSFQRLRLIANLCVIDKHIHETFGNLVSKACTTIPNNLLNIH